MTVMGIEPADRSTRLAAGSTRLRRGGLTRALVAAAAISAAAPMTANAEIVYVVSGASTPSGLTNVQIAGVTVFAFAPDQGKGKSGGAQAATQTASIIYDVNDPNIFANLAAGTSIDNSLSFAPASVFTMNRGVLADFPDGAPGFVGFELNFNKKTSNFGWARFLVSDIGGITLVDYAYENTGLAILAGDTGVSDGTVPAVPEPSTWAMMIMGFAMVGAALRAKRQRKRCAIV